MNYRVIFLILGAILFFGLSSCYQDHEEYFDDYSQGAIVQASGLSPGFYDFQDGADATVSFNVNLQSNTSGVSSVVVMKRHNNGNPVEYATLSEFPATISLSLAEAAEGLVSFDEVGLGDIFTFTFVVNMNDGRTVLGSGGGSNLRIPVSCISDLAGRYSVTTTYVAHDFLGDYPENTMEMDVVRVGDGVYMVSDFSGGLYGPDGPYAAAYGTNGLPVTFSNVCGAINWSGQSDPWGPIVPAEGSNNAVDEDTGVITIHWFCEAYGEEGISVYTPL